MQREWVTWQEVCRAAKIGRTAFYQYIRAGIVPAAPQTVRRPAGRPVKVWPLAVIAHLQNCRKLSARNVPFDDLPKMIWPPPDESRTKVE